MWSASGAQFGSRLMNTNPFHVPTLTLGSGHSSGTCGKSHLHGTCFRLPSRFQAMPWNGQRNSSARPGYSFRVRPRWRQMLRNALMVSGAERTTSTWMPAISYGMWSPTSGMSSSRQAICQTFFHTFSTSAL